MKFESTFGIGDKVEFTDFESDVPRQGIVFAVTVAEVGAQVVGYWYKLRLLPDETEEVEIEEASSEIKKL